jgi:asparagine synthase (glutamine-hydrolysing)
MCGICGFVGDGNENVLKEMLEVIKYRGPDDFGVWINGEDIGIGHRRLAILDIRDGHQPMATVDEALVIVFNGEIYNHKELREELELLGHVFRSNHSDTEVLLHGYRQWGTAITNRLNGMWALAIYDREKNLMWLSRDRFGKKPLYYIVKGDNFAFSSELLSLCRHPITRPRKISEQSLVKYFAYGYVPAPASLVEGIHKLPAGHNLTFNLSTRRVQVERYWRFEFDPDMSWLKYKDSLADALLEKLYKAVERRLQADVPVGVFLSGGVDSSSIAALAVTASGARKVRTYSIGFTEQSFDESLYSKDMAEVLGTTHTSETMSIDRCVDLLDEIYESLDEPIADNSLVPSFLLSKIASRDITVALGGDGADELFAGYDPFKAIVPAQIYSRVVPNIVHRSISGLTRNLPVSHRNMSFDFKLKRFLSGLGVPSNIRNAVWLGTLPPGHLTQLFGKEFSPDIVYEEAISAWDEVHAKNDVDKTLQFYTELYLQNGILTKMDRAGMLNSLEVRSPFLDIDLVDLVRTIPAQLKYNHWETKLTLKAAVEKVIPEGILKRQKKGFGLPVGKWFQQQHLKIEPTALEGFVDTDMVKRLNSEHVQGKADWRGFLWAHFVLEKWIKQI